MSAIGIHFELKANIAAFKRGMATASNEIKNLRKEVRESELGGGIKKMLGAGILIEGFRAVIAHAQETRKAFEEMGKPISESVRTVAELGDAMDGLKETAMSLGTHVIGGLAKTGEGIGGWIISVTNKFRAMKGKAAIESDPEGDKAVKKLNAEKEKLEMDRFQRNTRENLDKLDQKIAEDQAKNDASELGALEKRNLLLEEHLRLTQKLAQMKRNPDMVKNDQAAIKAQDDLVRKKEGEIKASDEALRGRHDKYQLTMEQLANADVTEGMNPLKRKAIMDAREAYKLQAQADAAGFAGNFGKSDALMSQAGRMRQGLEGFVKSGEVDAGRAMVDKTAEAVDQLKILNSKATKGVLVY